jgi:hypothetical protein
MSIFALAISRGPINLAFPGICAKGSAAEGNGSVEVLLPQGGHGLQLCCSGWSAVVGVDADGGSPDGDFTKEGGSRVAARRCPYRRFVAIAGAVSNLNCEVNDQLRPLPQITAPKVMILKGLRNAGKPG